MRVKAVPLKAGLRFDDFIYFSEKKNPQTPNAKYNLTVQLLIVCRVKCIIFRYGVERPKHFRRQDVEIAKKVDFERSFYSTLQAFRKVEMV